MKKSLLLLTAAAFGVTAAQGQARLSLYEEFSGENCGPCAQYNPGLNALIDANPSKVYLIKYQSPIPTAGPIYNIYKTVTNARLNYYAITGAPSGNLNGKDVTGHVANLTQANINSSVATTAPFNITVSHVYNAALDSFTATINVTATKAYSGTTVKLRVALIEDLKYSKAPGSNGETEFHHVVRDMFPDATGTALPATWTVSQNQSFTISGKIPAYVDKADANVVVWIQDDADKSIPQAAKSNKLKVSRDGAVTNAKNVLICNLGGTTATSTFTLTNAGSTTMTSAKIFYRPEGGSWASMNWTGSLASGASTSVTTPSMPVSISNTQIIDSVGEVNGAADQNPPNIYASNITAVNPAAVALPIKNNFEASGFPTNYIAFDPENTGLKWVNGNGTNLARAGSSYMPWFKVSSFTAGTVGYLFMPTPGTGAVRTLDFWHANAQTSASSNDKLEVVYTTDCGATWTSLWSKQGAALATGPISTAGWLPSPDAVTTDWKKNMVSLNSVPTGALLAFRATAGGGANLFVDDVEISTRALGVEQTINPASVNVFPNPSRGASKLQLSLVKSGEVSILMLDAAGRTVATIHNGELAAGNHELNLNTDKLASGLYTIAIQAADAKLTQSLSVIK